MQGQNFTVAQAAATVGCNQRTIRRHLAAGRLPGAHQQHTAHGPAWLIPAAALDKLRAHLALDVVPGAVEAEGPPPPGQQLTQAAGPVEGGQLGAALVALAQQQAGAIAAQVAQVEAARDDALWWRCEALEARAQVEGLRQQLAAAQLEAGQLRTTVERHSRPTVPLDQLRAQLARA